MVPGRGNESPGIVKALVPAIGGNVSRIWDALRRAERSKRHGGVSQQDSRGSYEEERRRAQRVARRVPVFVYGRTTNHEPFHEETKTLCVNRFGGLLTLGSSVMYGQRLLVANKATKRERECRVVYVGPRTSERVDVGIAFPEANPDFWTTEA